MRFDFIFIGYVWVRGFRLGAFNNIGFNLIGLNDLRKNNIDLLGAKGTTNMFTLGIGELAGLPSGRLGIVETT